MNAPKILVAIPTKTNILPPLMAHSLRAEARMFADTSNPLLLAGRECNKNSDAGFTSFGERIAHIAALRNDYIARHLRDTDGITHVLWIDADVVTYPSDLPRMLLTLSDSYKPPAIAAPAVYLQRFGERWYDIAGFVEDGQRCELYPPHFKQVTRVVELDSVGCVYMVPVEVYRMGARYAGHPVLAEHYALCQDARRLGGVKSVCDRSIRTEHAFLPDYGEAIH